jgi:hypothetical protein
MARNNFNGYFYMFSSISMDLVNLGDKMKLGEIFIQLKLNMSQFKTCC